MTTLSLVTMEERARLASTMINDIANAEVSVYVGIGHNQPWSDNDTLVTEPEETTDYINNIYRNLCALKLIQLADACVVVPRVDWEANVTYDEYDEYTQMFTYLSVVGGNGTVNVSNTNIIIGTDTTFTKDFTNNDILQLQGDFISLFPENREVISVANDTYMTVNLAFTGNFVSNTPYNVSNSYPYYAQNFYVRNIYDQVFLCLFNNFNTVSNTMPALSIGGDLPTDPYIITEDGYYWKYLYTITSGFKQDFFTADWMPVIIEAQVEKVAVTGALNVIKIFDGGDGYNNGAASFSAPILTVSGDGSGANLTAQVNANGTITGVNVIDAGEDYTIAKITVNPGTTGSGANLVASIPPATGGWGSNAALELGAATIMFNIELNGTEDGTIPVTDALGDFFTYRQVSMIMNPLLANNDTAANGTNYDMTTVISISANTPFAMNDLVYQSSNGSFTGATFYANVVWFDVSSFNLHINNVYGTFTPQATLYGTKSQNSTPYSSVTAFNLTEPDIEQFSGQLLYVENRSPITRAPSQIENVKLIAGF